jgi:hypothetical protein
MTFDAFESATRQNPDGVAVSDLQFRDFLKGDFQIIDGEVEAWSNGKNAHRVLHLDCEDATQWIVSTDLDGLAATIDSAGFRRLT